MDAMTHAAVTSLGDPDDYEAMLRHLLAGCSDDEADELGGYADDALDEMYGSSAPRSASGLGLTLATAEVRSRFSKLSAALARKGARDPDALAAYIGRKRYGRKAFKAMAAAGRRSAADIVAEAAAAILAADEARRFDPSQKRDPDGKWGDGIPGPGGGAIKDVLKLAERISLGDGEQFAGSGAVRAEDGRTMPMAWLHTPSGTKVRLGVGIDRDDERKWSGADYGSTVVLDQRGISTLADAVDKMRNAGDAGDDRAADLEVQIDKLRAHQRDLIRTQYPSLSKADGKKLDQIDEQIQDLEAAVESLESQNEQGFDELPDAAKARWREIDAEIEKLQADRQDQYDAYWADESDDGPLAKAKDIGNKIEGLLEEQAQLHGQREDAWPVGLVTFYKQRRAKIERLQNDLAVAQMDRAELTGAEKVDFTPAAWADLMATGDELDRVEAERDELIDEGELTSGTVSAEWGDLVYRSVMTDTGVRHNIAVRPPDAAPDWDIDDLDPFDPSDPRVSLTDAQLAELERTLRAGPSAAGGARSMPVNDLEARALAALAGVGAPAAEVRGASADDNLWPVERRPLGPVAADDTDDAIDADDERMFTPEDHPRGAKGSANGGQFAKKSEGSAQQKTAQKTTAKKTTPVQPGKPAVRKPAPRKVVVPKGALGYDPASNKGTGYGVPGGDDRVHSLQKILNRLGFTDLRGRKLADDGKMGPLTTSAVRRAQRALGVKADGIVTPELIKRLAGMKAPPRKTSGSGNGSSNGKSGSAGSKAGSAAGSTAKKAAPSHKTDVRPSAADKAKAAADADKAAARKRLALATKIGAAPPPPRSRNPRIDYYSPAGRSRAYTEDRPLAATAARLAAQDDRARAAADSDYFTGRSAMHEMCTRSYGFEFAEVRSGRGDSTDDGRTLEGYAAVFSTPARIKDHQGDFDEVIHPGAFKRSIARRMPVMQFDHGKDPAVGGAPIGKFRVLEEDSRGLHVVARLFADQSISRVREAIAEQAITGMSFRFGVPKGGDKWSRRMSDVDLRDIFDTDTHELGPVVFPAYDATTVSVRARGMVSALDYDEKRALLDELATYFDLAVDLAALDAYADDRASLVGAGSSSRDRGYADDPLHASTPDGRGNQDFTGRSAAWRGDGGDDGTPPAGGRVPSATPGQPAPPGDGQQRGHAETRGRPAATTESPEDKRLLERALLAVGAL